MWNLGSPRSWHWGACLLSVGCSAILNIDGHYVEGQTGSGGRGHDAAIRTVDAGPMETGGAAEDGAGGAATGGTEGESGGASMGGMLAAAGGVISSMAGAPGSGGALGEKGAVCTVDDCQAGLKCCGIESSPTKACYAPGPLVGCGESGCDHCMDPVPTHATAACTAGKCSFTCDPGFADQKGTCVATGTGGTGAGGANTGGHAGATGCSKDKDCPIGCGPAGFGCCMIRGICGCTWFNIELGGASAIDFGYCLPRPLGF